MVRLLAALIPIALVALGILYLSNRGRPGIPPASPRPALSTFCPKLALDGRTGAQLVDKELRNLGGGLMGESRLYRWNGKTLELHVGFEALEAYEDLDFLARGTVTLNGHLFKVSRSLALSYPLWAATFDLDSGPDRCREVTVIGHGYKEQRFRELLAAIELA